MTSDTMTQVQFVEMFGGGKPAPPSKRRTTKASSQAALVRERPELFQQSEIRRAEVQR